MMQVLVGLLLCTMYDVCVSEFAPMYDVLICVSELVPPTAWN